MAFVDWPSLWPYMRVMLLSNNHNTNKLCWRTKILKILFYRNDLFTMLQDWQVTQAALAWNIQISSAEMTSYSFIFVSSSSSSTSTSSAAYLIRFAFPSLSLLLYALFMLTRWLYNSSLYPSTKFDFAVYCCQQLIYAAMALSVKKFWGSFDVIQAAVDTIH